MGRSLQSKGLIALIAVIAVGVVVALFGVLQWNPLGNPAATGPVAGVASPAPAPPKEAAKPSAPGAVAALPEAPAPAAPSLPQPSPPAAPTPLAPDKAAEGPPAPSFDIVRVEPNGDSVIAGRGAPGATIEMLRDGQVHARTAADASGLFALVPPPLPPGSHQIVLQAIAPDGTRQRSKESVTIVVAEGKNQRPLVALASPDKPTVLLSNPEPPDQKTASAEPVKPEAAPTAAKSTPAPQGDHGAPRPQVKIVSVEAEDGGRLFVSGQGAPGATVRLYLNETFIAPGGVGGDGSVSFAIGRGVRPGDYRVRIDDVDPVSGSVKSRAEVAFNVPAPIVVPLPPPAQVSIAPEAKPTPDTKAPESKPAETSTASAGTKGSQVATATGRDVPAGTVVIPDINTTIVSRGDNLWRISQRIYGKGVRYTVIYGANQGQIRNPNLIYPGQVFVLPGEQREKAAN